MKYWRWERPGNEASHGVETSTLSGLEGGSGPVSLDSSLEEIREEQSLEEFISQGCGCHLGPQETQACNQGYH